MQRSKFTPNRSKFTPNITSSSSMMSRSSSSSTCPAVLSLLSIVSQCFGHCCGILLLLLVILPFLLHSSNTAAAAWWPSPKTTKTSSTTMDVAVLLERAVAVRKKLSTTTVPPPYEADALAFPSSYLKGNKDGSEDDQQQQRRHRRGFCNWLIPGKLMIGQYPGQTPEIGGPSAAEVQAHVRSVVQKARVDTFCCLQSEVPCQSDDAAWEAAGGEIFLDPITRRQFPGPFTHYAPLAVQAFQELRDNSETEMGTATGNQYNEKQLELKPTFLHAPIEDLSVPNSQPLLRLLSELLSIMGDDNNHGGVVYLHCWGGRGRAGLVGACLLSLIWPDMTANVILEDCVQRAYETRDGAAEMPPGLSRSPQTETQREFVRTFVGQVHVFTG